MLIFSHPREVTEKSVRRGEDTCLIHFFFQDSSYSCFCVFLLGGKCFMSLTSKCKMEIVYIVKEIMRKGDE